jgi:hypothetical protein
MKQTIDIDSWIIEATSPHNDGWTQLHYIEKLRELKDQLNSLDFLNEYNHGEKNINEQTNA